MTKANVNNKVNIHQLFVFEDSVYYFKIWSHLSQDLLKVFHPEISS